MRGLHVPLERVGQPNDHGEESRDVNGIDERILPHAGSENGLRIVRSELLWLQCELLQKPKCRAQGLADRRCAPVTSDRLPNVLAECVRRDRAV